MSNKTDRYFNTLYQEKNELLDYKYEAPVYGESNTDISYYEPNSTRIANMRKAASGLSTGVYDFDEGKAPDIEDCVVPIGRKPGMTFEEISQIQTINAQRIKSQSKKIEADEAAEKATKEAQVQTAVDMSKAITDSISK